jgi:hypothetical protein
LKKLFKTYVSEILFCSSHRIEQNGENEIDNGNHMTEINHFKKIIFFSCDLVVTGQLRWIARMSRELIDVDSFI